MSYLGASDGLVPKGWTMLRLGSVAEMIVPMRDKPPEFKGNIPWVRIEDFEGKYIGESKSNQCVDDETVRLMNLKVYPRGTVLCSCSCSMGATAIVRKPLVSNQTFIGIVPGPRLVSEFLYYALQAYSPILQSIATGAIQQYLSKQDFKNLRVAVPSPEEQHAIADFLDRETARVDDLISRKLQLLSLLQSRQEAVVRQIVVGQDLGVPKRSSGYYWLGDVPIRWKVLALKRVAKRVVVGIAEASTHAYADSGVPLVRTTNVKANKIDTSDLLYINKEFADKNRSKYMRVGDIVTARTGNPGISGVIPTELDGSQCFTMLITTLREDQVPEFFCYYINSEPARTYFALEGWGTAQINISVPILQMLPVPCPPEEEQRQIAERIKRSMEAYERQVNLINKAIERLHEYRLSLISAAVTGQLDIRNYRPQEAAVLCQ